MKGLVFSELIEMVEDQLGLDVADCMIEGAPTKNHGAYTSVGTYDHEDLIQLVGSLSKVTGTPAADLVKSFGRYLFVRLSKLYPQFFASVDSTLDFLPSVENFVHVEVLKLYPDAELPTFEWETDDSDLFHMTYRSKRPFADLAEGMLLACIEHFQDQLSLTREDLGERNGTEAKFTLTRVPTDAALQKQEACPS